MKTKILLSVLALGIIISATGQRAMIELTFTAVNQGQHVQLDSILIENLTESVDTTLYAPDTVLSLIFQYVSVSDNEPIGKNSFTVSQNYPNPVNGQTYFTVTLNEGADLSLKVYTLTGQMINNADYG